MVQEDIVADRREHRDRRERSGGAGRRGGTKPTSTLTYILRSLGAVAVLVLVIVYALVNTRPIYSTRGKLGEELRKHAPGIAEAITPIDNSKVDQWMATPKFQEEKRNFYEDVMRMKQVDSARADSIATFAVREAYVRGISPAIIFGVMLTENSRFISKATSNVGAVGLMQVYPKVWLTKEMTKLFGKDLSTDSTNVKYGVFILSQYFNPRVKGGGTRERDWQTALLRYNGCVRGTNTPRCHTYPSKVQRFVEGSAKSICDGRGFYQCIAKPFIAGLMGEGAVAQEAVAQPAPTPAPTAVPTPIPAPPVPQESAGQGVAPPADSVKKVTKRTPFTAAKAKRRANAKSSSRKSRATKAKTPRTRG